MFAFEFVSGIKIQKEKEFAFDPGSAGCPRAWQAVTHAGYRKL